MRAYLSKYQIKWVLKNIILGNIYRPPRENLSNENVQLFINELTPVLVDLIKFASDIVLAGDYNIDLLKMQQRLLFREYFENIIAHGLFPTLTLPTRVTDRSATLIDNIFLMFLITDSIFLVY